MQFLVVDLPGQFLGTASQNIVRLDADAAGFGWFIDPTPDNDAEFGLSRGSKELRALRGPAARRIDLLSVVEHELGHLLGASHSEFGGVMHDTLAPGVRRLIDLDEFFSRFAQSSWPA